MAIVSTAVGAPKKPAPTPAPEPTISKSEIIATLEHQHELNQQSISELKQAQGVIVEGLNKRLDGALVEIDGAKEETKKVQKKIDDKDAEIAAQAAKIAHFNTLCEILATIAAACAALLMFEMLKPTGLIGAAFTFQPWIRYAAPVATFAIVFGASFAIVSHL